MICVLQKSLALSEVAAAEEEVVEEFLSKLEELTPMKLEDGDRLHVTVCHANTPSSFYIHAEDKKADVDTLLDEMFELYSNTEKELYKIHVPVEGSLGRGQVHWRLFVVPGYDFGRVGTMRRSRSSSWTTAMWRFVSWPTLGRCWRSSERGRCLPWNAHWEGCAQRTGRGQRMRWNSSQKWPLTSKCSKNSFWYFCKCTCRF